MSMLRWSFDSESVTPKNIWFEHDGSQDHLLSDFDGSAHFVLVTDHWLFRPMYKVTDIHRTGITVCQNLDSFSLRMHVDQFNLHPGGNTTSPMLRCVANDMTR